MAKLICGHQDRCDNFSATYEPILDAVIHLHKTFYDLLEECNQRLESQNHTVIWLLSAACLKEFEEILLLCGNGYGTGAVKILRAFYERVITTAYLAQFPQKIQQFIDYSDIHWKKLLIEAEEQHAKFSTPPEERATIEANYQARKDHFQDACDRCGKPRLQISWTKASVPTMASKIQDSLRSLCANAYLAPTFHIHTTFWGILNQAKRTEDGKFAFLTEEIQDEGIKEALENAHILLLQAIETLHSFSG